MSSQTIQTSQPTNHTLATGNINPENLSVINTNTGKKTNPIKTEDSFISRGSRRSLDSLGRMFLSDLDDELNQISILLKLHENELPLPVWNVDLREFPKFASKKTGLSLKVTEYVGGIPNKKELEEIMIRLNKIKGELSERPSYYLNDETKLEKVQKLQERLNGHLKALLNWSFLLASVEHSDAARSFYEVAKILMLPPEPGVEEVELFFTACKLFETYVELQSELESVDINEGSEGTLKENLDSLATRLQGLMLELAGVNDESRVNTTKVLEKLKADFSGIKEKVAAELEKREGTGAKLTP